MNKNILNLNNRVGVRGIWSGSAIPVPAPLCIGFGESPHKSGQGELGSDRGRVLCSPSPPHFLSGRGRIRVENYRVGVGAGNGKNHLKNLYLDCNI